MGQALPRTLQTALSDVVGASGSATLNIGRGYNPPRLLGLLHLLGLGIHHLFLAAMPSGPTYMLSPSRKGIFG